MKQVEIKDFSLESYRQFLDAKAHPIHRVDGNRIFYETFHDDSKSQSIVMADHLFDYQQFIVKLCLIRKRFAVFAAVGLGKTAIFLEWVRHVSKQVYPKKTLILTQLHLINQTMKEQMKFYGWTNIMDINAVFKGDIGRFLAVKNSQWEGCPVGIVNIDKFRESFRLQDEVGAVVLDESAILKSATGKIRTNIINACKGIPFKMACSAMPAPNDRQEYASHALFLDYIDNYKSFFNKYFFNTGQGNEFVLKPHAKKAFYSFLSTWSIFLRSPVNYGFQDNLSDLEEPDIVWHRVPTTKAQSDAAITHGSKGQINAFSRNIGGIVNRNKLSQIGKGFVYADSK